MSLTESSSNCARGKRAKARYSSVSASSAATWHLVGDLQRQATHRRHPLRVHQLLLGGLEPRQGARQLRVEALHLPARAALALGHMAQGVGGQPDLPHEGDHGCPGCLRRRQLRRPPVEESRPHQRQEQTDPATEVVGVDRDQGKEEVDERAVTPAGEVEEREDEEEVDAERTGEDGPGLARAHDDEGEDAELVGGEPQHEGVDVHAMPGPQGDQPEGRQTADHHDGEQDGEHALVALEQAQDRVPTFPHRGRHGAASTL